MEPTPLLEKVSSYGLLLQLWLLLPQDIVYSQDPYGMSII